MKELYFLRPGVKIIPSERLIIFPGPGTFLVEPVVMDTLKNLSRRPLFSEEVGKLPDELVRRFLHVPELVLRHPESADSDFIHCPNELATGWILRAMKPVTLFWGEDSVSVSEGTYLFPQYRPALPEGASATLTPVKSVQPRIEREEWILKALKNLGASSILELGCGESRTLEEAFLSQNPGATYLGIDKSISPKGRRLKGDFLSELPPVLSGTIAVAEEVIEHLPPENLAGLIELLKQKKIPAFILTTPNKRFTELQGRKLRHPDHRFEWDENEVLVWIKSVDESFGTRSEVEGIGRKWKDVYPTWGIVIRLS